MHAVEVYGLMKISLMLGKAFVIVALAMFSLPACSRESRVEAAREGELRRTAVDQPGVSAAEQEFMMQVTEANVAEIMFARQAMQKSRNPRVKDFANMIESDHTKILQDLSVLMRQENLTQSLVPTTPATQEMDMMSNLTGAEFDREFANMMVDKHKKSIESFRNQERTAQDPDVRAYAGQAILPGTKMVVLDK
jgi:putative membrane protein